MKYPILLSIPSYFSVPWAKDICEFLKEKYDVKIVAGGRWVTGEDGSWLKERIPQIDLVVPGMGEGVVEKILDQSSWGNCDTSEDNYGYFTKIDFSLLHEFTEYHPCIEVSRGCGKGCSYCVEKNVPLSELKEPEKIIEEMHNIISIYENEQVNLYFQASFFNPDIEWARKLKELYKASKLKVKWRCETRVDGLTSEILKELAQAGLKVIDFGLESASINQLKSMGKTSMPEVYLEKAGALLQTCKILNIWVKINVLLFAGETIETFNETVSWLAKYKDCIKGVSVNPLFLYNPTESYIRKLNKLGAKIKDFDSIHERGFSFVDLSPEIDYELATEMSMKLSRMFMTMEDYFDLKSFSYFKRSYKFKNFKNDIRSLSKVELPFEV